MSLKKSIPLLALAALLTLSACSSPESAGASSTASSSADAKTSSTGAISSASNLPDYTSLLRNLPQNSSPSFESFSSVDLGGETVTQDIFGDYELTMVNIWATFCGPCIREMPELGEIAKEYKEKGVQIIGIVTDVQNQNGSISNKQIETANQIIQKTGADYPHLLPSNDLYRAQLNQVDSVPTTIFVDKEGKTVGESYVGARSKEQWLKIIDELLGGSAE